MTLLFTAILAGCGGNSDLGYVTGTITLDDKPLPNAFVTFISKSGGTTSFGRTDQNGEYEMMFSDDEMGSWIGTNRVEISTGDVSATMTGGGAKELVPAAYNRNSTLEVEVVGGNNVHDFKLDSSAGKIIAAPTE